MKNWHEVVVSAETPLEKAIARIDASSLQVALVLNDGGTLAGIVTDGDIRRSILRGLGLQVPVSEVMSRSVTCVQSNTPRNEMLTIMRQKSIHHLPLVDDRGIVTGLVTLDELIGATERPNWVVLMVGGLGTRLQPMTQEVPKPLLPVGGKPILETILESFAEQGFRRIFLSVNYKADMIREYFGAGDRWGVRLEYLQETTPLGTAGGLALLPDRPTSPIVVMNGDLLTRANFDNLLQFHRTHSADATMAVREYDIQVPYGVVRLDGARISGIDEKPVRSFFVSAGIYALSPEALEMLPSGSMFDMPVVFERLIAAGKIAVAYPLREYWLDVGRLEEFERANREWTRVPR